MKAPIVMLLCVGMLLFSLGCKKKSKELTTVNFHVYNPVSGEGFEGVKVKILQQKEKGSGLNISQETETIWEGITDANGKANYSFKCYNNRKYVYWPVVEKEFLESNNHKLLKQPDYQEAISKNDLNIFEYEATVPASYILHIKNVNCFNQFDRFRYRVNWLYNTGLFDWSNWSLDKFDCYEAVHQTNGFNDYLIYQYEVERNSILNTYTDTFYINPNFVDTLKIYY